MTQVVAQVRHVVARSGFVNPLTLAVLVTDTDYLRVYADEEELTLGADYTVAGIGSASGVSVTIIGADDVGNYVGYETFTALYDPPLDQTADLSAGGGIGRPYEVAIDQQNRRLQALADRVDRAIKLTVNIEGDQTLPWPPLDNGVPAWDELTSAWVWGTLLGEQGPAGPQGEPGLNGTGTLVSVVAGTGIDVDNSDVNNPVVGLDTGTQALLTGAFQQGGASLEVGDLSDTSITRVAAGRVAVEGTELQKQPGSNGLVARTAAGTAAARSIDVTGSTGLSVTNGDGVAGNPTLAGVDATTSAKGVVELAVASEFRTGTDTARALGVAEVWSAAQSVSLTDAATVTVSLAAVLTLAHCVIDGNRTLDFTNLKEGQHFVLMFTATNSTRTLTMDAIADLWDGVEAGPYSITTSQTLFVCGFVPDGATSVEITAIGRRAT